MNKLELSDYRKSLKVYVFRNVLYIFFISCLTLLISYNESYDFRITVSIIAFMITNLFFSIYKNFHNQIVKIERKNQVVRLTIKNVFTGKLTEISIENEPVLILKYHMNGNKVSMNQFSKIRFICNEDNNPSQIIVRDSGWNLLRVYFYIRSTLDFAIPAEILTSLREMTSSDSDSIDFIKRELDMTSSQK